MADLSDVNAGLVALLATTMYPSGTSQPSVPGLPIRIYPGWPTAAQLDADLLAGTCHISVFNRPEATNATRYQLSPQDQAVTLPALTLTISGRTVTVGATVSVGVNCAILVGTKAYLYQTINTDTLSTIATALAALINVDFPGTTASAAVITLPAAGPNIVAARVGGGGTQITEVGRIEQRFQITVWANSPSNRDSIARLIGPAVMSTHFMTLADGSAARLIWKGHRDDDSPQKEILYRRDIFVSVEYPETMTTATTTVVDIVDNVIVGVNGYNGTTNSQLYPNTTTTNI